MLSYTLMVDRTGDWVKVRPHKRWSRGHRRLLTIGGHTRHLDKPNNKSRYPLSLRERRPRVNKTVALQDALGHFHGRKHVDGIGDKTGVNLDDRGRIIGRTKAKLWNS